jgi:hypothetical protein
VVKVLAGRELGIGAFAAMSDIHIIEGKPVIGARILAALVRQSAVYDYEVVEWTNERCAIDFFRHGKKLEPTVEFTEEDARRAGLNQPTRSGKPSNHMKFARAMSSGVGPHRLARPDLRPGPRPRLEQRRDGRRCGDHVRRRRRDPHDARPQ